MTRPINRIDQMRYWLIRVLAGRDLILVNAHDAQITQADGQKVFVRDCVRTRISVNKEHATSFGGVWIGGATND